MCGIYGMVSLTGDHLRAPEIAHRLSERLAHRGPDGVGEHRAPDAILGARRLRIIDRRPQSDQPYSSVSGKTLVCNGEIYNGVEIRNRFREYPYQSRTDVEAVLPLVDRNGIPGLTELDGMFAIGIWDRVERKLWLARDRAGEKPLFYLQTDNEVWFASEMHALLLHPTVSFHLDRDALNEYLVFGFVREPRTLYHVIRKVPAGRVVEVSCAGTVIRPIDAESTEAGNPFESSSPSLLKLLETSVRKQLRADVPVGVFLSGGIDSSLVTALAIRQQPDLHTFTVRFNRPSYDEGLAARRVAATFKSYHHEVVATFGRLERALHILVSDIDEPISDPAVLPTILLAEKARKYAGVVMSGEGSDELFGGYPTYLGHRWARVAAAVPQPLVRGVLAAVTRRAASTGRVPTGLLLERLFRHAGMEARARHFTWFGTGLFPVLDRSRREAMLDTFDQCTDPVSWAMDTDYRLYLREGLLTKLDRATMRWGLEARTPFLDRDVVSYARRLATDRKVGYVRSKIVLADVARDVLPGWIVKRRKRGLSVPIAEWLNNDLKDTVDRVLDPGRIAKQGLLADLPLTRLLGEHRSGRANHARALWALVVLQLWLEHRGEKAV